jgi:IstB-like ATP binding protein
VAHADGSIGRLLLKLSRVDVLVLDDFAMAPLKDSERRDFLEICDDRYQRRSLILTSQMPIARWHEQIGDPSIADSILDRLVHNAYRIELHGDSIRKEKARKAQVGRRNEYRGALSSQTCLGLVRGGNGNGLRSTTAFRCGFQVVRLALPACRPQPGVDLRTAGLQELCRNEICTLGGSSIEIRDRFWPYQRATSLAADSGLAEYIERVKQCFLKRCCVRSTFTAADENLAAQLYRKGVSVVEVERAILLGCMRKYITLTNNGLGTPITSLHYFRDLIAEVRQEISPTYWDYIAHKIRTTEEQFRRSPLLLQLMERQTN